MQQLGICPICKRNMYINEIGTCKPCKNWINTPIITKVQLPPCKNDGKDCIACLRCITT